MKSCISRISGALKIDMRFQLKQGFYVVYLFLTVVYIVIVHNLPKSIHNIVVPVTVALDPTVVGFFFIGGIVMLEKTQGVLDYVIVTPLTSMEYLISKVISLAILAETATIAITLSTYGTNINWIILCCGVLLTSTFFTLYGFIVVVGCKTINQYFVKMVPYMLAIVVPGLSLIWMNDLLILDIIPIVAGIKLIFGSFNSISFIEGLFCVVSLLILDYLMFFYINKLFIRRIIYEEN